MSKKKNTKRMIMTVLGLILCFGIMAYPMIANTLYDRKTDEILTEYQSIVQEERDYSDEWEACAAYNAQLLEKSKVCPARFEDTSFCDTSDYERRLCVTPDGVMAYVRIPRLSLSLPVYHSTDAAVLEKGIGHIPETSLPSGGVGTHSVLTGHTGVTNKTLFTDLNKLEEGDYFYLLVLDELHAYRVSSIHVVLPYETELLEINENEDLCTLITCTPYGVNTHRLLVTGKRDPAEENRVNETADDSLDILPEDPAPVSSTWAGKYREACLYGATLAVAVLGIGAAIRHLSKSRRKEREKE